VSSQEVVYLRVPVKASWDERLIANCESICSHRNCLNEYYEYEISKNGRYLYSNSSKISVMYPSLPFVEFSHQPKNDISELIAKIGGWMGIFVGQSIFSLCVVASAKLLPTYEYVVSFYKFIGMKLYKHIYMPLF